MVNASNSDNAIYKSANFIIYRVVTKMMFCEKANTFVTVSNCATCAFSYHIKKDGIFANLTRWNSKGKQLDKIGWGLSRLLTKLYPVSIISICSVVSAMSLCE